MLSIDILEAVGDVITEAIEIVDNQGKVIYINKHFTILTGIMPEQRINKNIFDEDTESALAVALRNNKNMLGYHCVLGEQLLEFIVNVSVILNKGKVEGAIAVYTPLHWELKSFDLMTIDQMEKYMIQRALSHFGRNIRGKRQVALALNISLATLYNKIKRYNINEKQLKNKKLHHGGGLN